MGLGVTLKLASAGLLSLLSFSSTLATHLPVVDLGYARYRASSYNATGDFYDFEGIRYARPPTGKLRFQPPQAPKKGSSAIKDGSDSSDCISAGTSWKYISRKAVPNYLAGKPFGVTKADLHKTNSTSNFKYHISNGQSEDCLFLNVVVPKQIFKSKHRKAAPVLVWIYGGGYVSGQKKSGQGAAGLIHRSQQSGREGLIFVSMNYRLGAFGWLAGPTIEKHGVANAGLRDQRFALEWVQNHIHLFGGDKNRVTIFGESAGGGSVLHQITAFSGKGSPPFQQAILQSPGFHQQVSPQILENQYNRLLQLTDAKSFSQLRELPVEKLAVANAMQVYQSEYGFYTYGPAVDSSFVPALPGQLLLRGQFYKNLKVLAAYNTNEGVTFADPFVKSQKQYKHYTYLTFPTATKKIVKHIADDLYPPDFSGDQDYTDPFGREAKSIKENAFSCATYYVSKAFGKNAYSYQFAIPPALHGNDVKYTFYNGGDSDELANQTVAVVLQDYITTFAQNGKPTSPDVSGLPDFKPYSPGSKIQLLNTSKIVSKRDPENNKRCEFWQKAPFAK